MRLGRLGLPLRGSARGVILALTVCMRLGRLGLPLRGGARGVVLALTVRRQRCCGLFPLNGRA